MAALRLSVGAARPILGWSIRAQCPATSRSFHGLHRTPSASPAPALLILSRHQPTRRTPISQHHPILGARRNMSASTVVDAVVTTTQHLFTGAHLMLGTPWFLTIPLVALTINLATRVPLAVYGRRILQRRASLSPLLQAWLTKPLRETPQQRAASMQPSGDAAMHMSRLNKAFGVQRYKDWSGLLGLPIWLTGIEAVRRLCGTQSGLLGLLVSGREALPAEHDLIAAGADYSMATGGCLWFPDLMVADPLHILPFALSAILLANVLPWTKAGIYALIKQEDAKPKWGTRIRRGLIVAAAMVGPLTMNVPAALHLYWITTSASMLVVHHLIATYMPVMNHNVPMLKRPSLFVRPRAEAGKGDD
ncbi:hypothetical protein QBC47DRAFT_394988 [Echria macrotheca]|uniref:Uncharacterized protein n=1 Tax=Echria macrotheca TaxID=438768 RepID=A0AAJ0B1L4_9PEZI|nr:hypothetical protein QBC47DRAFT_394988 [Echria macrotheca]